MPFKSFASFVLYLKMHTQMLTQSLLLLIVVLLCLITWEILSWVSGRKKITSEAEVHIVSTIAPEEDPFRTRMREVSETNTPPPGERPPGESVPLSPLPSAPPRHPVIETSLGGTQPLTPAEPFPSRPPEEKVVSPSSSPVESQQILTHSIEAPPTAPPPPRKERKSLNLNLNMEEEDPWKALLRTSQKDEGSSKPAPELPASPIEAPPPNPDLSPPSPAGEPPSSVPEEGMLLSLPEPPARESLLGPKFAQPAAGDPGETTRQFPEPAVPRPALSLEVVPEKEIEPSRPKKLRSGEKDDRELRIKALELEETLKKVQSTKTENETKEGDK
ncbi:MAG: hypothetical protein V2A78_09720 [bacterium]